MLPRHYKFANPRPNTSCSWESTYLCKFLIQRKRKDR